jgi:regulator of replication initiation timing
MISLSRDERDDPEIRRRRQRSEPATSIRRSNRSRANVDDLARENAQLRERLTRLRERLTEMEAENLRLREGHQNRIGSGDRVRRVQSMLREPWSRNP